MFLSDNDIRKIVEISINLTSGYAHKVMSKPKYKDELVSKIIRHYDAGKMRPSKKTVMRQLLNNDFIPFTDIVNISNDDLRLLLNKS